MCEKQGEHNHARNTRNMWAIWMREVEVGRKIRRSITGDPSITAPHSIPYFKYLPALKKETKSPNRCIQIWDIWRMNTQHHTVTDYTHYIIKDEKEHN